MFSRLSRLRLLSVLLTLVLLALSLRPGPAGASPSLDNVPPPGTILHPWSGEWNDQFGAIGFRYVSPDEGVAALADYGAQNLGCSSDADYYRGGYDDGPGQTGQQIACTAGDPSHIIGRYVGDTSSQGAGDFDLTIVRGSPLGFAGTYTPDGGTKHDWHGTFKAHFQGDGCCTAPPIEDTQAYSTFLGLKDPAKTAYPAWVQAMTEGYVQTAATFPGATNATKIPGATMVGQHSFHWILPGNDFFVLLALAEPPHKLASDGNVFARASLPYEPQLQLAIQNSAGNLLPGDVLRMALQITGGRYPLAVLTVHNLLKTVAATGRDTITYAHADGVVHRYQAQYVLRFPQFLATLREQNKIVAKLQSLRRVPNSPQSQDKMGPWYHAFAILTMGAFNGTADAWSAVDLEHGLKFFKGFKGEAGFNLEKFLLDRCWATVTSQKSIQKLDQMPVRFPEVSLAACSRFL